MIPDCNLGCYSVIIFLLVQYKSPHDLSVTALFLVTECDAQFLGLGENTELSVNIYVLLGFSQSFRELELSLVIRGVNWMVNHDSIRYRFSYPAIRYLLIPKNYRYDYDSIQGVYRLILYILNNHLHFY